MSIGRWAVPALVCLAVPATAQADTLFFPVVPCRIADTRLPSPAPLGSGQTRTFDVVGPTTNFSSQGGSTTGCGIPGFAGSQSQVQAVAVNVTAVDAVADGHLRVFAG